MSPLIIPADDASIMHAAGLLRAGKLVSFPTETVYGLGADATNGKAVAAIYEAKVRPTFNPLIIHVAEVRALDPLIEWTDTAKLLATSLWPGALTLILRRRKDSPIALLASAGLDTLAVRIPSHPIAQKLLRTVGLPIAAPSANASGRLSPTTPMHVVTSLGDKVDMILADGRASIGIESTVIDMTSPQPLILRPGGITQEQLELILGHRIELYQETIDTHKGLSSPGMLASHYAPHLSLRLNILEADDDEAYLTFGSDFLLKGGKIRLNLSADGDVNEAAANLFAMLHELDKPDYRSIAVAPIPLTGLGVAINDRLMRAATR